MNSELGPSVHGVSIEDQVVLAAVREIEQMLTGVDLRSPLVIGDRTWALRSWNRDGKLRWVRYETEGETFQIGQIREPRPHADHLLGGELTDESRTEVARLALKALGKQS